MVVVKIGCSRLGLIEFVTAPASGQIGISITTIVCGCDPDAPAYDAPHPTVSFARKIDNLICDFNKYAWCLARNSLNLHQARVGRELLGSVVAILFSLGYIAISHVDPMAWDADTQSREERARAYVCTYNCKVQGILELLSDHGQGTW